MKKILLFITLIALVVVLMAPAVLAQDNTNASEESSQTVSLLPDSPLYFFKQLWEKFRETFTLRTEAKLQLMEKLGEKRALEAEKLIEKGKSEQAEKVMNQYNERLQKMEQLIEKKGEKLDENLDAAQNRIMNRFENRNQNLQRVMEKAPEAAKPGLQRALENSKNQLQNLGSKIQDRIQKRDELNNRLRLRLQNVNSEDNINQ